MFVSVACVRREDACIHTPFPDPGIACTPTGPMGVGEPPPPLPAPARSCSCCCHVVGAASPPPPLPALHHKPLRECSAENGHVQSGTLGRRRSTLRAVTAAVRHARARTTGRRGPAWERKVKGSWLSLCRSTSHVNLWGQPWDNVHSKRPIRHYPCTHPCPPPPPCSTGKVHSASFSPPPLRAAQSSHAPATSEACAHSKEVHDEQCSLTCASRRSHPGPR